MLRNAALTLALLLLPAVATAQHTHGDAAKKTDHPAHASAEAKAHVHLPELLMQKRTELNLTDEQVAKLEDVSAKMVQHHAEMKKAGAKHDTSVQSKLHEELLSIFTEEQLTKIRPLMKQHMEGKCAADDKQCKTGEKKPHVH